jgi:KDO2-lipid IV(A) lauroyltransferase
MSAGEARTAATAPATGDDGEPGGGRRVRARWWHPLVVGLLRAILWTLGALPAPVAYLLADLLAVPFACYWSLFDRRGARKKGYWRNVAIAFRPGGLAAERPRGHLWRWERHLTWLGVDCCRLHRLNAQNFRRIVDVGETAELQRIHKEGKGIIWATAHIGIWDIAGYVSGLLGMPIISVFRPSPIPGIDRLVSRLRTGTGQTVVAKWNVLGTLKQALKRGDTIGLLVDSAGNHGTAFPPFLGTAAATVGTPALLHLQTGAPIVVIVALRRGRFRFTIRVFDVIRHPPSGDRDADVRAILARVNAGLTAAVREAPEQWFWQSRRFRHRPPGEVAGPDGLPPVAPPS